NRAPLPIAGVLTDPLPQVTSVQISSGSSKFELAGVGTVALEGPADFQLTGPMRARLSRGRVKVHVTQETGRGFVVETPDGEVTDLGTEFGLDVADRPGTGLVVFQGAVDLRVGEAEQISDGSPVNRLVGGEGVRFSKTGQLDRIMSIITGPDGSFQLPSDSQQAPASVITQMSDNIHTGDTKKFYEIVSAGMREDAIAYVDRQEHQWNGLTAKGLPQYLIGADYVKPFNNDKVRQNLEIELKLSGAARLFIIWDDRLAPTEWLKRDYQRFGDRIGLDMGKSFTDEGMPITTEEMGIGPGNSIDRAFSIWERDIPKAGVVKLGATGASSSGSAMYGIAAVRLSDKTKEQRD
ncbi:MAG: FecR domain-containing protein, partial [Pirellulales bacterium]|nr:FecR domain-containing protein [Pirellulales bacterium]